MHKPTNARLHKCTNQQTDKRTFARAHGVLSSRFSRGMSHTAPPLLPPCFDIANLKIKIHISKHKRMFVYMCMYLFVCLFVRLLICTCMRLFMRLCVCACICVFAQICFRVFMRLHVCTITQMHKILTASGHLR